MKFTEIHSKEKILEIIKNSKNRVEVLNKLGVSSNSGPNRIQLEEYITENSIDVSHFEIQQNLDDKDIFKDNSNVSQAVLRRHYKNGNYSEYKCSICGLEPIWKGKPLSFKLDHIDGKTTNNELFNLRWVCPNCDRQLDTFGAKNKNYFNKEKPKCSKCGKILSHKTKTGLCIDCYNEENKSKKRNLNGVVLEHNNFKDICPICKTNYKNLNSKKCKECEILELRQKSLNNLSTKIPKEVLKDYLKNKSKKKILEDFKIQNSQLKRLCEYYNLPYLQGDIQKYTNEEWKNL